VVGMGFPVGPFGLDDGDMLTIDQLILSCTEAGFSFVCQYDGGDECQFTYGDQGEPVEVVRAWADIGQAA